MSFRGDDQRRYGHIPPVQYPVASQPPDQQGVGRRLSFNANDDGAYQGHRQDRQPAYGQGQTEDELFITSPTGSHSSFGRSAYGSTNSALSGSTYATTNTAFSGYQHQYHDPTQPSSQAPAQSYNPQTFGRSQSTNLPYHPHPSSRYQSNNVAAYGAPSPPGNYTPQTYNPAAYASAAPPQRHATYHGQYDHNYAAMGAQHASPVYGQSPGSTYTAAFSPPAPSPAPSSNYQQTIPSPSFSGAGSHAATPTYDPSHYNSGQYSTYSANGGSPQPNSYATSVQAPYPTTTQMPVGPQYSSADHTTYSTRVTRSDSQASQGAASYASPQSPTTSLQRHPTNAPLPSRPMDDVPEEQSWNVNGRQYTDDYNREYETQESIIQSIEAELGGASHRSQRQRPIPINGQLSSEQVQQLNRYGSNSSHAESRTSPARTSAQLNYDDYDDDPEGAAGVLAMQQAELDDQRFSSNSFGYSGTPVPPSALASASVSTSLVPPPEEQAQSSDSEYGAAMDIGMFSGGYAGNLAYGGDFGPPTATPLMPDGGRPLPQPGYPTHQAFENAPAFDNAEVDYGGTGGLQDPKAHRLSFDEGEERVSVHSRQSGTESPTKDDYQDLFYHPGLSSRPLPALPPAPGSDSSSMLSVGGSRHHHAHSRSVDVRTHQPEAPGTLYRSNSQYNLHPERSISLSSHIHSNTPQVQAPARSRTDAAEERRKTSRQHHSVDRNAHTPSEYDSNHNAPVGAYDNITLPTGRKRKFVPSKLTAVDFARCLEPWALSGIVGWIRDLADGEMDLREKTVEEALTLLFTFKVPTMNVADAEALGSQVLNSMLKSSILIQDEEWIKFGDGRMSGVLWQLTGSGCYAPKLHDPEINGRCYSHHCTRTLKKVDLEDLMSETTKHTDEWHVFYGLKKEDWEAKPKKEVERQNMLHEIVTGEEKYIQQLDIFRTLYRDDLRRTNPPIIHPDRREKFLGAVFGKLDTVLRINKDHLLSQLKYRQQEQGPWITGFSDLFREWIRKAKADYIEYATGYPRATYMVRKEANRNILFKKFLEDKQKHKSSSKQDWTHFLITPLQRLQRYILLLESVEHKMLGDSEEKTNLNKAIEEIKTVTHECDAKVAETTKRVEMMELDRMLVLRPGFQSVLNLDHLGRTLIIQGDLQRLGSKGMSWVDTHALLFDHYLILAKIVLAKDGRSEKKYDVSREPIPMPLLFLESMNEEPVTKQKGITAPLGRTTAATTAGSQLNKVTSNGGRPGLEHAPTGSSMNSLTPSNNSESSEGKILYPFKVKHLGHEVYTLYASSARDRMEWCTKIVEAKTRHAKALFSQNAEPFRLRVLADASFHYDASSVHARTMGVPVKGTPLDRAVESLESVLGPAQGVPAVCRAQVNCAAGFTAFGKDVIAVGTDYGVFITDPSNPRGWSRTVQLARVTQIAVLEEFSLCLVIADKTLISYQLDMIAPVADFAPPSSDSARRAPLRLAKDVTYFATARMKDRMLVFYKRKEGLHTSFKVLEPIYNKASEKKSRLFGSRKGGTTEAFRDFDEFFFPTECFSLSLFQTYIAVATAKGIEMLTLDKKQPMSIPDLKAPAIANIAGRIRDQRPLGMFRLNENEFILTYEDCAVYVDKHGDVSRTLIMEYTGKQKKARGVTMYGQYLLLFNDDYVEVRNADNGRLRQIIAGRDVRVIDYGVRGPTGGTAAQPSTGFGHNGQSTTLGETSKGSVKIAMSHPELQGRQIILEMLLNDGHAES